MKKLQLLLALIMFSASTGAWAEYACPAASNNGGGWSPAECSQTPSQTPVSAPAAKTGYACPAASNTGGGWTPLECTTQQIACADCGTVENVNAVETEEASGLGAVAGAVAGGVLGNQVGKGKGRILATVAGAVAGGVGGHYGEKLLRKKTRWDVIVLMDDGTHRTVAFDSAPSYKAGDKVKVNGNSVSKQ